MDVFDLRDRLVADYQSYTRSFIKIRNDRIRGFVNNVLDKEGFWSEPLLQLNPTFEPGGTIDDLVEQGALQKECARIFRIDKSDTDHVGKQLLLPEHQQCRSTPTALMRTTIAGHPVCEICVSRLCIVMLRTEFATSVLPLDDK